jgi:hypothetical protein
LQQGPQGGAAYPASTAPADFRSTAPADFRSTAPADFRSAAPADFRSTAPAANPAPAAYPPTATYPSTQPVSPMAGQPNYSGAATPQSSAARLSGVIQEPSSRAAYDDRTRPSFY